MKNFSTIDITSAVVGFPANIGVITRIDGTVIRFGETDISVVVGGDTYVPIPGLQVSGVKHTSNGEMPSCQIVGVYGLGLTFDSEDIAAGLFAGATVQLYKINRLDLSSKGLLFTGAISNITCDPIAHRFSFDVKGPASSAKIIMTQKRQPMCRTDLFSTLCQVDKTLYDVATTVATVGDTAFTITVTGSLAQATGYFNGGTLVTSSGIALVISNWDQSTQTISTFKRCKYLLTVGDSLTLYPGCDKTDGANGCGRFSNYINFQGENHYSGPAAAAQQV